jgi:FkbM family methyltransferase
MNASTGMPRLDALKAAIAALNSADPGGAENELRAERLALAREFLAAPDPVSLYAGEAGERHRPLVHSGLRDLERDDAENGLGASLDAALGTAQGDAALLAAMLLFHGFELPRMPQIDRVAVALRADYTRYLVSMPRIFAAPGDAARYGDFAARATSEIRRYVDARPPLPEADAVRDAFFGAASFLQVYFNERNLLGLYRDRAALTEQWGFAHGARLAHTFPLRPAPARLRVGILCTHYTPQTETYFMLSHFERFPRERCSLILYALSDVNVPLSQYARSLADATVDLPNDSLAAAAERIRADELDVLLIGSNVTVGMNPVSFLAQYRLARTQVISASSPVTSGLTAADWYLSAEQNEPAEGEAHHTEKLFRMPGMLTRYAYNLDTDPRTVTLDRADLGIPKKAPVFFSASNFFKVVPELSGTWARILARVPEAHLILMPFNHNWSHEYLSQPFEARILRQVEEAGGDPEKVHIIGAMPTRADLHGIMALADVYLDSYPFAGACSLLDPLLVGLPVVARQGTTFRSSVGSGMLQGLGIADMALADDEAYVARAVELAASADLRKRERARIEAAVKPRNPVFDSETGSRNMESAFVAMAKEGRAADEKLSTAPAERLRALIESLSSALASGRNAWFAALSDFELVRQLVLPYFESIPPDGKTRRIIDVGACLGQLAEPFLQRGWRADLFEPDPGCRDALAQLAGRFGARASVHHQVVSDAAEAQVTFYQSATGLSGLSPSPYGETARTLTVPSVRLKDFVANHGGSVDFLKIDTEGWDFHALATHDFEGAPPRLAMVEFGSEFPQQPLPAIEAAISEMAGRGFDALVFSYEDYGNFKRQVWRYELIAARLGQPVRRADGHAGGNILFFRRDDGLFLATAARALLGCLPARERLSYLQALG